jgi:hypothetical protein
VKNGIAENREGSNGKNLDQSEITDSRGDLRSETELRSDQEVQGIDAEEMAENQMEAGSEQEDAPFHKQQAANGLREDESETDRGGDNRKVKNGIAENREEEVVSSNGEKLEQSEITKSRGELRNEVELGNEQKVLDNDAEEMAENQMEAGSEREDAPFNQQQAANGLREDEKEADSGGDNRKVKNGIAEKREGANGEKLNRNEIADTLGELRSEEELGNEQKVQGNDAEELAENRMKAGSELEGGQFDQQDAENGLRDSEEQTEKGGDNLKEKNGIAENREEQVGDSNGEELDRSEIIDAPGKLRKDEELRNDQEDQGNEAIAVDENSIEAGSSRGDGGSDRKETSDARRELDDNIETDPDNPKGKNKVGIAENREEEVGGLSEEELAGSEIDAAERMPRVEDEIENDWDEQGIGENEVEGGGLSDRNGRRRRGESATSGQQNVELLDPETEMEFGKREAAEADLAGLSLAAQAFVASTFVLAAANVEAGEPIAEVASKDVFPADQTVYSVQVGAFRNRPEARYFGSFSPVIAVPLPSGVARYLTGIFSDYASAARARDAIRDIGGFEDAFVVVYENGERAPLTPVATSPEAEAEAVTLLPSEEGIGGDDWAGVSGVWFSIQIGAFQGYPTADLVEALCPCNREMLDGRLTRWTTGKYQDLQSALTDLEDIRASLVEDAFVVAFADGRRIKIADAVAQRVSNLKEQAEESLTTYRIRVVRYGAKAPAAEAAKLLRLSEFVPMQAVVAGEWTTYYSLPYAELAVAELAADRCRQAGFDAILEEMKQE